MNSLAGEQLPLTSFFKSTAPGNTGKQAKRKAAALTKANAKQTELPTPASSVPRTRQTRAAEKGQGLISSTQGTFKSRADPHHEAIEETTQKSGLGRASKQSKSARSLPRKRRAPEAAQTMTPQLSSPERQGTVKTEQKDGSADLFSSPLSSLTPSPDRTPQARAPAKKRRLDPEAPVVSGGSSIHLPTPSTMDRPKADDRLRQALRFRTPPRGMFECQDALVGPNSPSPARRPFSLSREQAPTDTMPQSSDNRKNQSTRSPSPLFRRTLFSPRKRQTTGSTTTTNLSLTADDDEPHHLTSSAIPMDGTRVSGQHRSTLPTPSSTASTSLSAEKPSAYDMVTVLTSPVSGRGSPTKIPSSQDFESPIKARRPNLSPIKSQTIVPSSQYFEQSFHHPAPSGRDNKPLTPQESLAQSCTPTQSDHGTLNIFSPQPFLEDDLSSLEILAREPLSPTKIVQSSQTQLMTPQKWERFGESPLRGGAYPVSPVKSSQPIFDDDDGDYHLMLKRSPQRNRRFRPAIAVIASSRHRRVRTPSPIGDHDLEQEQRSSSSHGLGLAWRSSSSVDIVAILQQEDEEDSDTEDEEEDFVGGHTTGSPDAGEGKANPASNETPVCSQASNKSHRECLQPDDTLRSGKMVASNSTADSQTGGQAHDDPLPDESGSSPFISSFPFSLTELPFSMGSDPVFTGGTYEAVHGVGESFDADGEHDFDLDPRN